MNAAGAIGLVEQVCARRHFSLSTQKTYCGWVGRYCEFLRQHGGEMTSSRERVTAYLSMLARRDVAASTQNQAFQALLFFYGQCLGQPLEGVDALRAKRGQFVRYCPGQEETAAIMREVQDCNGYPCRLIVHLLYGCGLRLCEPLGLRVRDVDLTNSELVIRQSKGAKDRVVHLPCSLAGAMKQQLAAARVTWQADVANGVPVKMPHQMARKAPALAMSWAWSWVFPLRSVSRDPRSGEVVRWHCLDQPVQRAMRAAGKRCNLAGVVTPHSLRHAFATHSLRNGACVRDVQEVMGHANIETTMGYCHADSHRVASPIDRVLAEVG